MSDPRGHTDGTCFHTEPSALLLDHKAGTGEEQVMGLRIWAWPPPLHQHKGVGPSLASHGTSRWLSDLHHATAVTGGHRAPTPPPQASLCFLERNPRRSSFSHTANGCRSKCYFCLTRLTTHGRSGGSAPAKRTVPRDESAIWPTWFYS